MKVISVVSVSLVLTSLSISLVAQQAKPAGPKKDGPLIAKLDKEKNDGYQKLGLTPGDVPGAVTWCWNDHATIGQDCGWNDPPYSFMARHDLIAASCKIAVATDCKVADQVTMIAAKCQCHNPGVAQDMLNHPAETCAAVKTHDPCF